MAVAEPKVSPRLKTRYNERSGRSCTSASATPA